MNPNLAISQYQQLDLEAKVASANPRKLVSLLFNRASVRLAAAHAAMARLDIGKRTNELNGVIEILAALNAALDISNGGQLAQNLRDLYTYMELQIVQANRQSDPALVEEVQRLLGDLQSAWDAMPLVE
jgi:flagellar protein FliS